MMVSVKMTVAESLEPQNLVEIATGQTRNHLLQTVVFLFVGTVVLVLVKASVFHHLKN